MLLHVILVVLCCSNIVFQFSELVPVLLQCQYSNVVVIVVFSFGGGACVVTFGFNSAML